MGASFRKRSERANKEFMPRPIIMLSNVSGFFTCRSVDRQRSALNQCCDTLSSREITAEEEEARVTLAPTISVPESSSTPPALESQDVISAIASQISDNKTLATLSRIDKTAHDVTA